MSIFRRQAPVLPTQARRADLRFAREARFGVRRLAAALCVPDTAAQPL